MGNATVSQIIWHEVKQAFLRNRLVESIRWWFSQQKIRSLGRQLNRRDFLTGVPVLLLAPFIPAPPVLSPQAVREAIVSQYLRTQQGRLLLAQSMIQPLRTGRDYTAMGRKVFAIEQASYG